MPGAAFDKGSRWRTACQDQLGGQLPPLREGGQGQKKTGFTITMITAATISSVGASFATR